MDEPDLAPKKRRGRPPGVKNRSKAPEVVKAMAKLKIKRQVAKIAGKARARKRPAEAVDTARDKSMQVKIMASTKVEIKAMADMVGMGVIGFRKKYSKELNNGHDYVYAAISMKLVGSAMGGDMRAMLAWLRQFGGWEQVTRKELTGKNGEPISIRNLDGPSLIAIVEALGAKGATGRSRGRNPPQIDYDRDSATDLDAIPGTADESADE